jgi:hypothetical protein
MHSYMLHGAATPTLAAIEEHSCKLPMETNGCGLSIEELHQHPIEVSESPWKAQLLSTLAAPTLSPSLTLSLEVSMTTGRPRSKLLPGSLQKSKTNLNQQPDCTTHSIAENANSRRYSIAAWRWM